MSRKARSSRGSPSRQGRDRRETPVSVTDHSSGSQAHEYANTIHCDACRTKAWKYTHRHASRRFERWMDHLNRHHRKP